MYRYDLYGDALEKKQKSEFNELSLEHSVQVKKNNGIQTPQMATRFGAEQEALRNKHEQEREWQEKSFIDVEAKFREYQVARSLSEPRRDQQNPAPPVNHTHAIKIEQKYHQEIADRFNAEKTSYENNKLEAEKQERLQRLRELNAIEPTKGKDKGFSY